MVPNKERKRQLLQLENSKKNTFIKSDKSVTHNSMLNYRAADKLCHKENDNVEIFI